MSPHRHSRRPRSRSRSRARLAVVALAVLVVALAPATAVAASGQSQSPAAAAPPAIDRPVPATVQAANDTVDAPDRFESNDDPAAAPTLTPGRYGNLTIVDADVDVFAVDLAAGETLDAAITFDPAADNLSVAVVDASGTVLAGSTDTPVGAETAYVAPAAGTYYVRVVGSGAASAGYELGLRIPLTVSLSVAPRRTTVEPNATAAANVSLAGAGLGTSSYAFDLAVDPSVATLTAVEPVDPPPGAVVDATVAPDGASASVAASNLTGVSTDDGPVPLVRVRLATTNATGESALTLSNASVVDGVGAAYDVSTVDGAVVVSTGPGNVGGGAPATDPDGDGLFEDVDGDGDADFFDVVTLLFAADRIGEDGLGASFDFDGDGDFDFLDVVDLLFSSGG